MHLTLRQLAVCEAVARNLSYTRAAKELHLSQPAVSMQVRQVEDSIGLALFEKTGKQIHCTEAGVEVHRYAQEIQQQLRELEDVIASLKGVQRGHLRLSVASTANHFSTRLLAAFAAEHPGTTFSLDVTNRKQLLDALANNETDMVLMGQPPEDAGLESIQFMENPLVVIAAANHPLASAKKRIPLKRLEDETFVVRELHSGTRIAMNRFFADKNIKLRTGMEMNANEAIKQTVAAGLGLGLVSIHTLELELETGRLVVLDVEDMPIQRHWHMVHREGKRLTPVVNAFQQFLLSERARPLMRSLVDHPVAQAAGPQGTNKN